MRAWDFSANIFFSTKTSKEQSIGSKVYISWLIRKLQQGSSLVGMGIYGGWYGGHHSKDSF